jgi:excisionase family DNA binding protein
MARAKPDPPAAVAGLYVGRRRAAQLFGISTQTVDALVRSGALKAYKLRRRVLIRLRDLEALVQAGER